MNLEAIRNLVKYIGSVLLIFFPGAFLLDHIFSVGLFHRMPATVYEFVLFAVYAGALSVPIFLSCYIGGSPLGEWVVRHASEGKEDEESHLIFHLVVLPYGILLTGLIIFVYSLANKLDSHSIAAWVGWGERFPTFAVSYAISVIVFTPILFFFSKALLPILDKVFD